MSTKFPSITNCKLQRYLKTIKFLMSMGRLLSKLVREGMWGGKIFANRL